MTADAKKRALEALEEILETAQGAYYSDHDKNLSRYETIRAALTEQEPDVDVNTVEDIVLSQITDADVYQSSIDDIIRLSVRKTLITAASRQPETDPYHRHHEIVQGNCVTCYAMSREPERVTEIEFVRAIQSLDSYASAAELFEHLEMHGMKIVTEDD